MSRHVSLIVLLFVLGCSPALQQVPPAEQRDPEPAPQLDAEPPPATTTEELDSPETSTDDVAPAEPIEPEIVIDATEFTKATVPIEDPHESMVHFYERLASVAREEEGAVARISLYSDSVNGTDLVTSALRRAMQKRFGDGGRGFLPIAKGWHTQYQRDVVWNDHKMWSTDVVNRGNAPGNRYGLAGVLARNRSRHAKSFFATVEDAQSGSAVARYRLFYQAWPRGGAVQLSIDDREPVVIETASETVDDRVFEISVEDGPHELMVRVAEGHLRLYGVAMEREGPGVVVDSLMLIGARARRLALFDGDHFGKQIALRESDLVVFWMGGNDAESSYFDREGFVRDYSAGIAHARAERPEASCLVASVMDMGQRPSGRTRRRVPGLVELERQLAHDQGCAFFDLFEAMGGAGTARRWFRSRPRMISGDYQHVTPPGAHEIGQLYYQTLLRGFAEHLGYEPPPPAEAEEPST